MRGHIGPVPSAAFAPDGAFVLTGGSDQTVRLWDTVGAYESRQFGGVPGTALGVGFSHDGNIVYALTAGEAAADSPSGNAIHSWKAGMGGSPESLSVAEGQQAISFAIAPDGQQAAVGCQDGTIRLIDLSGGEEVGSFSGHSGAVHSVAFSPDGAAVVSGGEDGAVLAFNRNSGAEVRRFVGHEGPVRAVAISPDGSQAISGGDDRMVRFWVLRGGQQRAELRGHEEAVTAVAFGSTGDWAVTVGRDGRLIVWKAGDLREGRRFDVPGGPVLALAMGADGKRVVTASEDGVVRLWGLVGPPKDAATPELAEWEPPGDDPRAGAPGEDDRQTWEQHIRNELFQAEFEAAKRAEEKVALAETLLGRGRAPHADPDAAYAFLDLARQLAVEAGDAELALNAVDDLSSRYDVDGMAIKLEQLQAIDAAARGMPARRTVVERVLDTVEEATRHERFAIAENLLDLARSAGRAAPRQALEAASERLGAAREAFEAAEAAREELRRQPDDSQAALILGKHKCFVQDNWQTGLPLLARGADERLAEVAAAELAEPGGPQEQLALADDWWEVAENESGQTQARIRWHAASWYQRAKAGLAGELHDRVQGRILAAVPPGSAAATRQPPPPIDSLAACRTPQNRDALLRYYGGDEKTEAAVGRALEWLARHQFSKGYWSFDHQGPNQRNPSANPGTLEKAPHAATALALLPFLAAGHSARRGEYRRNVVDGVNFLRARMIPVGSDMATLYERQASPLPSHALATCALAEVAAVTSNAPNLRAAQSAVNFVVHTQNPDGGWPYRPQPADKKPESSDFFTTTWNLTALQTAQWAGLRVADGPLSRAEEFLQAHRSADGAGFTASPRGSRPDSTATPAGMLAKMHLGWRADRPELIRFAADASERGPATNGHFYQNLCTAQVLRDFGGRPWLSFSTAMRNHLLDTQADAGPEQGSWYIGGQGWGSREGGRLFSTAMAALLLETYYRHPPLHP